MDFRGAVAELSEVLFRFRFRVPPHFALVIRALGALEGTVIRVDPNFKVCVSTSATRCVSILLLLCVCLYLKLGHCYLLLAPLISSRGTF